MGIKVLGQTSDRHPRREWNSPERRKERQAQYMEKHGERPPRRKRLTPADTTRTDRLKKIGDLHERIGGGEKAKPHSSREGRVASGKRKLQRYRKKAQDIMKPITAKQKRKPYGVRILKAKGGRAGTGPTPGQRIKARKSREREWWTSREGPEGTEGDTRGQKFFGPLDKELRKKRPHSSPEGRDIDVKAAHAKYAKRKDAPWKKKRPARTMTPYRAKKAAGGVIKKGISQLLKPKGVFKPNGAGKVNKRFLDFIKTGKHVDKHGVKVNVPKAAERLTGKPHVDHGKRKRIKHLGKGKAEGGRIGLKHGSAQSHYLQHGYGPTKTRLRTGKPKIAIKGWS
jgi:hypothetical protein